MLNRGMPETPRRETDHEWRNEQTFSSSANLPPKIVAVSQTSTNRAPTPQPATPESDSMAHNNCTAAVEWLLSDIPAPKTSPDATLDPLRPLLNCASDASWNGIVDWLTAAFHPDRPCPALILHAPPGSGNTTAARLLRTLTDPNSEPLAVLPSRNIPEVAFAVFRIRSDTKHPKCGHFSTRFATVCHKAPNDANSSQSTARRGTSNHKPHPTTSRRAGNPSLLNTARAGASRPLIRPSLPGFPPP